MIENISDLRLLIEIVRSGHISRGGKTLGLSPALASKRLQRLEESMGLLLINRTTRQISLTEEGRRIYERAQDIVEQIDEIEIRSDSVSPQSLKGHICVSSPVSLGRKYVTDCVVKFLRLYPQISIKLILDDMHSDLLRNGIDMAIKIVPLTSSNFIVRKISKNDKILVAGANYVRRCGHPKTIAELKNHNALILGNYVKWNLMNIHTKEKKSVIMKSNFRSNNGEATAAASHAGLGICIKSVWDVIGALKCGDLVHILPDYVLFDGVDINVIFPSGKYLPLRIRTFLDFIIPELRQAVASSAVLESESPLSNIV